MYHHLDVPGLPALTAIRPAPGAVHCRLEIPRRTCQCGHQLRIGGPAPITLTDLPRGREPSRLVIAGQRWSCPDGCKQSDLWAGLRAAPVGGRHVQMTQRLFDVLLDRYLRGEPVSALARWCGRDPKGLRGTLRNAVLARLHQPRSTDHWGSVSHIGIDELFWQGRVLCVIVDLVSGALLELLPDREPETLSSFLHDMNALRKGSPPVFVTDMWMPYREVLRSVYGKDLQHVCDRFHLQAKIGEDLREAARAILPSGPGRTPHLRAVNAAFLSALKARSGNVQLKGVDAEFQTRLTLLVRLAVQATEIWRCASVPETQWQLEEWQWQRALVKHQLRRDTRGHDPFGRFAYLTDLWRDEVLAYCNPALALPDRSRPSGGRLEAANSGIRRLLRQSWHARRAPFSGLDAERWDEQGQFDRLWVRAMYARNKAPEKTQRLKAHVRPDVTACPCGVTPNELQVKWHFQASAWDRPVGEVPLRVAVERASIRCPSCRKRRDVRVPLRDGITSALRADLLQWRREGWSLTRLHRMTGVSVDRIRTVTAHALRDPSIRPPYLVGLLRWRWRGLDRWVLTDPEHGRLVDILPGPDREDPDQAGDELRDWLVMAYRRGTREILVGDLAWVGHGSSTLTYLVDRFTTMNMAHRGLREVLWRFTSSLPVAARRAPELRRHRFAVLAHPAHYRRIDDQLDREALLGKRQAVLRRSEPLALASQRIDALRTLFTLTDEDALEEALSTWLEDTAEQTQRRRPSSTPPIEASLHFGFRPALVLLDDYREAVVAGLHLQATKEISLGSSRRLLRTLNEHPASRQRDFEYLRRSALYTLGRQP